MLFEIIKHLEIQDIIELTKTCSSIYLTLKSDSQIIENKRQYWDKLIRWKIWSLSETLMLLSRKIGDRKVENELEDPVGSDFEKLKISYDKVEFKKYYAYIDFQQRTIIKWIGKEFGRVKYRTLEKLVQRKPPSLETFELSNELLQLFDQHTTVVCSYFDRYEFRSEIMYQNIKIGCHYSIDDMRSLDQSQYTSTSRIKFSYS